MSFFPLEIIDLTLTFLDICTLRTCLLVSPGVRVSAQRLLCSHLNLSAGTMAQCELISADGNRHLYNRIKKLTIQADALPVINEMALTLLASLGRQIEFVRLDGRLYGNQGIQKVIPWSDLPSALWDCLHKHILPHIVSLEILELAGMPLFRVLRSCKLLRYMHIRSSEGVISSPIEDKSSIPYSLTQTLDLSLESFDSEDFTRTCSLAQCVEHNAGRITSLHLGSYRGFSFPTTLEFLRPFPQFTAYLQHLSIGRDCFLAVDGKGSCYNWLPFALFPRLETLSCTIFFSSGSSIWFDWMAGALKCGISSSQTLILPLKKLRFNIIHLSLLPHEAASLPKDFDDLANHSGLSCTVEFRVSALEGSKNNQSLFRELRENFPSWDQRRRLMLWIEMYTGVGF
ncbi:hypothetical protein DL96DRAFT_1704244 [Flagelloscypha sp. PMI_526]|nr:hypothetical protein DL96DRAFT_1704244 [Flagelloscypha sp. PMI_526]